MKRKSIPEETRQKLLLESGCMCVICGARGHLQICHMTPLSLGGSHEEDNLIVLCPMCHDSVDRAQMRPEILKKYKQKWVNEHVQARGDVIQMARAFVGDHGVLSASKLQRHVVLHELAHFSLALSTYQDVDQHVDAILQELEAIRDEGVFLRRTLKPILESLGFQGVTVLHHTSTPERGKDLVFYDRDRLGSLTFFAVVACVGKIHANAAKTSDSGHYQKILDQVAKCFLFPYKDCNLKAQFFIDKVIVACSSVITDEAMEALQLWEEKERRHLIYLPGPDIAGIKLKLSVSPLKGRAQQTGPGDKQ